MIDVFIRTMPGKNPLRDAFIEATTARWKMELKLVDIRWLVNLGIREARLLAEKHAISDPYIFTDDDVLPWGKDWVRHGTEVMLRHPQYAAASTRSVIAEEMGNYQIPDGAEMFEIPCVGAPMWLRKGIIKDDLPEFPFVSECVVLHSYMREKGFKQGIIAGIFHLHLGFGFATNPDLVRGY